MSTAARGPGPRRMQQLLCTVCDKAFAFETDGGEAFGCPRCERQRTVKLRADLMLVTEQRDALLRAIEVKSTVVPL